MKKHGRSNNDCGDQLLCPLEYSKVFFDTQWGKLHGVPALVTRLTERQDEEQISRSYSGDGRMPEIQVYKVLAFFLDSGFV